MEEIEKAMYYGAKPETFEAARILREHMTTHEKLLWERLKLTQIDCQDSFSLAFNVCLQVVNPCVLPS